MNTLQSSDARKLLLVPMFAALAVYAQASQGADSVGDTQSQVRSVLEGGRSNINSSRAAAIGAPSRVADVQGSARQILLGAHDSSPRVQVLGTQSTATSSGGSSSSNRHGGGDDVQKQTQRLVFGRAAS